MEHTIRITHAEWEVMGDHSLSGMFACDCLSKNVDPGKVTKLIIEVEQTSMAYRRAHGPLTMLVPEFMPAGIMRNILHLTKSERIEVDIRDVEINPCRVPKCCNWEIQ